MIHKVWHEIDALLPLLAQSGLPRTPGVHLSDLYGKLHPVSNKSAFPEKTLSTMALGGFAVEKVLERGLAELMAERHARCVRPDEIVSSEGVIGSPDLFFYGEHDSEDSLDIVIGDIKCKWLSLRNFPTEEEGEDSFPPAMDKAFSQLMSYLYVLSEIHQRVYLQGRIIIYFVNAAGKFGPPRPELRAWDLFFSEQEVAENWSALMTIARGEV